MPDHIYLAHHGIKGQKWGVRRFQNDDGTLTEAGRKRYGLVGSTKAYIKRRRGNVDRFYKQTGDYVHDKLPEQMTKKERASYEKANAEYKKAQKEAGRKYREDLKKGVSDSVRRTKEAAKNSALGKHASMYAERNKKIASEFVKPSHFLDYAITDITTHATGGSSLRARAVYAYNAGQRYMMNNHSVADAMHMRMTDAAIVSTAAIGAAAVKSWRYNHPTYEV